MVKRYVFISIVIIIMTPLFLLSPAFATEKTIFMDDDSTHEKVYEALYFLKESGARLTIEDITRLDMADQFKRYHFQPNEIPNFGYVQDAYWAKLQIENIDKKNTFLLEIAYPAIEQMDVYVLKAGVVVDEVTIGAKFPFNDRVYVHPNFLYDFELETDEIVDIYIRMDTHMSAQFPLYVHQQDYFYETKTKENLLQGITYGVLAVMALYNLFIFFSLRHIAYFYYVLVIFATFLSNIAFTGIGYQYIWPNAPQWNAIAAPIFLAFGMVVAVFFAHNFLEIKKHLPKFHTYYMFAFISPVLTIFLLLISSMYALHIMAIGLIYQSVLILISAWLLLIRRIRQARFFVIGWSVFLIGVILTMFSDAGILPLTYVTKYAGQVGAMIEVVILSFALADRINILQNEKREAAKQLYMNQKATNEELLKIDKLKDEFLATTSHELRTPLNGIIGMTEMLQEGAGGKITPHMKHQLSLIQMSGKRLVSLINDILDYAQLKNETLKLEKKSVHVKEHVALVTAICKPLLKGKNIQIINLIDEDASLVLADENRLQQILFNLVGNAMEHTIKGKIIVTSEQKGDLVYVKIVDTGVGIPAHELPHIFDQFYQVNNENVPTGTGIGLSITKKLVELHGGDISVTSIVGEGTTCIFSLPVATAERTDISTEKVIHEQIQEVIDHPVVDTIRPKGKKHDVRILIADDEMINLQVLIHQLSLEGYEVIYAKDGTEVLGIMEEETIDLVILDMMMPKMSGLEVCKRLRKTYGLNDLPILMLTARSQLQDKIIAFDAGANDYVVKPCERKELLARVKTLIHLRKTTVQLNEWNRALEEQVALRTEALNDTNDQLQEALQSKQTLLRKVIHELGTPVTTVYSYVQAVEEGLMDANDRTYIEILKEKVKLLMRLIDDLAHVSTLNESQFEYDKQFVRLDETTMKTARIFKFEVEHAGRNFIIQYDKEALSEWYIHVDMGRMEQVFTNIIANAIHYTEVGSGEIFVRVDLLEEVEKVCIMIRDNGVGIQSSELPLIFERFYKGENWRERTEKGSTGLGLAIVKEIMEGHDGRIWAESDGKSGMNMYLMLPITRRKN